MLSNIIWLTLLIDTPPGNSKKRSVKDNGELLGPDTTGNDSGKYNFTLNIRCAHIFHIVPLPLNITSRLLLYIYNKKILRRGR